MMQKKWEPPLLEDTKVINANRNRNYWEITLR